MQGAGGTHRYAPLAGHPRHAALPDESSWARGSRVALHAGCACIPRGAGEAELALDALLRWGWRVASGAGSSALS